MEVREYVRRPAVTCRPSTALSEVARLMRTENVGSVVVVDQAGRIAGIVTDRDLVVRGLYDQLGPGDRVDTVMSRDVQYVFDGTDVMSAVTEMATQGCRRLPVLDRTGTLIGVLSFDDLVVAMSEQLARLGLAVRMEIARPMPATG